jgi:hypothetical protein
MRGEPQEEWHDNFPGTINWSSQDGSVSFKTGPHCLVIILIISAEFHDRRITTRITGNPPPCSELEDHILWKTLSLASAYLHSVRAFVSTVSYLEGIAWLNRTTKDFFTINAVAQDEFEDVIVPDAPAQSPRAGASTMTNVPVMK